MVANVSAFLSSDKLQYQKGFLRGRQWLTNHLIDLSRTRLPQSFNKALKSQIKQTLHSMRVGLLPINTKQIGGLNIVQSW